METQTETKLTNPPTKETKMVAQTKGQKTYKLVALRPFNIGKAEVKDGQIVSDSTKMVKTGDIVEVSREQAKDLCKEIKGSYSFSGERYNADKDVQRHNLTRARLATEADLVVNKPITPIDDDEVFGD